MEHVSAAGYGGFLSADRLSRAKRSGLTTFQVGLMHFLLTHIADACRRSLPLHCDSARDRHVTSRMQHLTARA